jgi:chitinase
MKNRRHLQLSRRDFNLTKWIVSLCMAVTLSSLTLPGAVAADTQAQPRVVGYFPQWGVYGNFYVKNLVTNGSAKILTQVDYAFAELSDNKCASADTWADYQQPLPASETVTGKADSTAMGAFVGNFHQLQELKQRYPNLKVAISIGGGSANPAEFSVVADPAHRKAFVKSCIDMFVKGQFGPGIVEPGIFDGFDIDWEYPASDADKQNLTGLLAEFRSQMNAERPGLVLSIAASAGSWAYQFIDLKKDQESLDFYGLMNYDFDGPWNNTTGFVAPLLQAASDPDPTNNANAAVMAYLAAGVKPEKIVFGVPFYGYEWTGVPKANHGLFEPGTPVGDGSGYNQIVPPASGFTQYRNPKTQEPWLYNGTSFWTYDDPWSIAYKMLYVRYEKLGGVMAWDLSGDTSDAVLLKTAAWTLTYPQ